MRKFVFVSLCFVSFSVLSQDFYRDELNPLTAYKRIPQDERLIEPVSVVLGKSLVAKIRESEQHPSEIFKRLLNTYPEVEQDLQKSALAYFETLYKPLVDFCSLTELPNFSELNVKQIEQGAIPLFILLPLHQTYREELKKISSIEEPIDWKSLASFKAKSYQKARFDCQVVKKLNEMEDKAKKYLPKRFDRLVNLNHQISSAEASFPRIQFSVNGLTQYVYEELFSMPIEKLEKILRLNYEAQKEWLERREKQDLAVPFYSYAEKVLIKNNFLPREALLLFSYSTRNKPSLDVHYGYDTKKALLLEIYFWKLNKLRDMAQAKYLLEIFPNVQMKNNPGVYHYMTAALLACDVRLHGYSGATAVALSIFNKTGYKIHKLLGALGGNKEENKSRIKSLIETAKLQGFGPGITAGKHGGRHGVKFCRKYTPKQFWLKNKKNQTEDILTGEDIDEFIN